MTSGLVISSCQVADLGLSRETGKTVVTKTCGRITYAPPVRARPMNLHVSVFSTFHCCRAEFAARSLQVATQ